MKNQNQEKRFEVVIPPTDVLENELQEVLGGAVNSECFSCPGTFNCNKFKITELSPGTTDTDCEPDQTLIDGYCIPNKYLEE